MKAFFRSFNALSSRREFLFFSESFSFLSADLMRAILFYEERSGHGRVLVRENLPLERDEFALYTRIGNAQNELSLVFFLNPSKKRKKGCPLSRNLYTRARSLTANAKKREGKKRSKSITYLYLHAFVCAFYSREFFFLSCVCAFCFRALGFEDILLSRFQNARYFSIFLLFFKRNCAKGGNAERKRRHEVRKERGCFFLFFGGKDLFVVLPKSTQT